MGLASQFLQRVLVHPRSEPAAHALGELINDSLSRALLRELGKNAGAGSSHAGVAKGREPVQILGNDREMRGSNRLQVVATRAGTPVGGVDDGGVAFEFRRGEDRRGGYLNRGLKNHVPRWRESHGLQFFADAFGKGVLTEDEDRYVCTEAQSDFL